MGEQSEGVDEYVDSIGGIETESLVGDDADVGHLTREILCDKGDIGVAAHEDGHLLGLDAFGLKSFHDIDRFPKHLVLIVIASQKTDADVTAVVTFLRHFLTDVGIGAFQLFGLWRITEGEPLQISSGLEEGIVEGDDAALGTVVGVEGTDVELLGRIGELLLDIVEQSPVA